MNSSATETLKSDQFGQILALDGRRRICRDLNSAHWLLRPLARLLAANEARSLMRLAGLAGVPQLLAWDGLHLQRSYLAGEPMQRAQPRNPAYYRAAHRLLKTLRARGVVHNDLAKEPNWLVDPRGKPALVDFQLSWASRRPGPLFRLLAREDLRHLLKHKRSYCPQALTPIERRVLARQSWIARGWRASGKRLYKLIARRLFGYWDNEGQGRIRDS